MRKEKQSFKVEIYFILYLVALILLLPDKNDEAMFSEGEEEKINFRITPEKSVLNLRMLKKGDNSKIISFDSVNNIYYSGKYDNIYTTFEIKDVNRGELITLSGDNNVKGQFEITEDPENNLIKFKWNPNKKFNYNTTYLVKLNTVVEKDGMSKVTGTQFTLNSFYINQVIDNNDFAANDEEPAVDTGDREVPNLSFIANLGEMQADIENNPVIGYASQKWQNRISVFPIESLNDLTGYPEINIRKNDSIVGGDAKLRDNTGNKFIFEGSIPAYDTMNVEITFTRKIDNQELTVNFPVIPVPRVSPDLPKTMYPGETYTLKANFERELRSSTYVRLKIGNDNNRYDQSIIQFTPKAAHVGKVLRFERYVNDVKLDSYDINIIEKPAPEVINHSISNNRITIKTKAFNPDNRSNKNMIVKVENKKGVEFKDIRGEMIYEDEFVFQTFRSEPIPNDLDNFVIYVIDKNDKKSEEYEIDLR